MIPRVARLMIALIVGLIQGCASVQLISQQSVEGKIAQVKLGVTTMGEVETLFGTQHGSEDRRWFYNLSDTAFEISERKTGTLSGVFPVAPATVATNTRALISVRFTAGGKVSALEVARFFDLPFNNDYWYLVKDGTQNVLDSVMRSGEASDFRVAESDKAAGMFTLEDGASSARVVVKLENQTLHITSNNPHDRLTSESRVFSKKERAFTNNVSAADFCIK
jgi:hypothetical protein